jgi:DNA-binding LacI/PurR family transcriptional regulator
MNAGISIPNDLSVAGFNNIPSAESSPSQLFSLDIPIAKVAETAVAMLHFQSEQTITSPFKVVLPCNQIILGTSASIRQ